MPGYIDGAVSGKRLRMKTTEEAELPMPVPGKGVLTGRLSDGPAAPKTVEIFVRKHVDHTMQIIRE